MCLLSLNRLGIGLKTRKQGDRQLSPGRIGKPDVGQKEMKKNQMVVRKRVQGKVEYNDGEFAEIQTIGIEGIEKNLLLETIQIHRGDTENTPDEFQGRFPVSQSDRGETESDHRGVWCRDWAATY